MVPHAGRDSALFRDVVRLGDVLGRLGELRGSVVPRSRIAILWDQEAGWGTALPAQPTSLTYLDQARRLHAALVDAGVPVDVVPATDDLDGYDVVLVPTLYLAPEGTADRLAGVVARGGQVVVTYFSGIVDAANRVLLGGYPGEFRELLGVRGEEFAPLPEGGTVTLSDGSVGEVWTERFTAVDADVVSRFTSGPSEGGPAVTRRRSGGGSAWYVSTRLDAGSTAAFVATLLDEAGIEPVAAPAPGVELVRRVDGERSWVFAINHTDEDHTLAVAGHDLVADARHESGAVVPARGVVVVRED
ncbi:beta-galactosidase [Paraoerskovia sediminicola]